MRENQLYFNDNKNNKKIILIILLPIVIMLGACLFSLISNYNFGTNPEDLLNHSKGMISYSERTNYLTFEEYYNLTIPKEENYFTNYNFTIPKITPIYTTLDYSDEYYESCQGKKIEINFSNIEYPSFLFNYSVYSFNYTLPLYYDVYSFSDNLKSQDCYYGGENYVKSFLQDPYNNKFIEAVSKDFQSLQGRFSQDEILEIATIFVQSIPYESDYTDLNRYPYETFYEHQGNCLDKSLILVGILNNLGYEVYIITGDSEGTGHAIVGVACEKGIIKHNSSNICFIETTEYYPISIYENMTIDEYIPISETGLKYKQSNYGPDLENTLNDMDKKLEEIYFKLEEMQTKLDVIDEKMSQTDCVYSYFCDDANEYNRLARDYNIIIGQYNPTLEDYYRICYATENIMFNNVEILERNI
jgi:hypothetical protein